MARAMVRRGNRRIDRGAQPNLAGRQWLAIPRSDSFRRHHRNLTGSPIRFIIGQIFGMNFVAGVPVDHRCDRALHSHAFARCAVSLNRFRDRDCRDHFGSRQRLLSRPAYPAMFAIGRGHARRLRRWLRTAWFRRSRITLLAVPVVLPILVRLRWITISMPSSAPVAQ